MVLLCVETRVEQEPWLFPRTPFKKLCQSYIVISHFLIKL